MKFVYNLLMIKKTLLMRKDISKINELRRELKNYDLKDFLCNISALLLIPENQSKSVIFQCMISTALSINQNEFNRNNKMSIEKFKSIVTEFSDLNRKKLIDPPEFPFVLPIIYYENYHLFMGSNSLSPLYVNTILKVVSVHKDKIDKEIYFKLNKIISGLLKISEDIYRKLNLNLEKLKSYDKDLEIFIPSSNTLNRYKDFIMYSNKEIYNLFNEFIDELVCDFGDVKVQDISNFDYQLFYLRPFLKTEENIFVLDITTFISLIMNKIFSYVTQYSTFDFFEEYNKYLKFSLIRNFHRLGNYKIDATHYNIQLVNNKNVGEELYSSGNDGVIINILLFDTGEGYGEIKNYISKINRQYIYRRIQYIINMLVKNGIKNEKIVIIITPFTIGRNVLYSLNNCNLKNILILTQYEIDAISINESEDNLFFFRYLTARKKMLLYEKSFFSELNLIALYVDHDYSFYFNDNVDIKNVYLTIIGKYSADYIKKAYITEGFHLVKYITDKSFIEVIKLDKNVYFAPGLFLDKQINKVFEFNNFVLWFFSEQNIDLQQYNLCNKIIDVIIFWFSQLTDTLSNIDLTYSIVIKIEKNITNYSTQTICINNISEVIKFNVSPSQLKLQIKNGILNFFSSEDNKREKEFMLYIINILSKEIKNFVIDMDAINEAFKNPYKKKTFIIDLIKQPYMIPFSSNRTLKISHSDENLILDKIGLYLSNEKKIPYGIISDKEILNYVVKILYNQLVEDLKLYEKESLLKFLYLEYEKITSSLSIHQNHYANDISCYPDHKIEIDVAINELHKSSVALRFLIELSSSLMNTGNMFISQYNIEYDLALAAQIIEWAYSNDLFYYEIIKSPIVLLKSNRVGFNKNLINKFGKFMFNALQSRFSIYGKENNKKFFKYMITEKNKLYDFEKAFFSEFKYEYKDYFEFMTTLLKYAEKESTTFDKIFTLEINTLIDSLAEKINKHTILKIIDDLSLKEREDYLIPPKQFRREDVYPWRNNRNLSLSRRPLIINGGKIIYGYRTVFNSVCFLIDLINSGKFCANSKEMKEYISKISNFNGELFNMKVYNYISSFGNLVVDMKVKKINNKKIVDNKNNKLGDIDVLFISKKRGLIVVCETKNFELAKNFYEIHNEYLKMFDFNDQKSFYNKHLKRVDWVKNHIDDLIVQYNLSNKKWNVEYLFIVDDYMISKDIFNVNVNITTLYNLEAMLKKF